MFASILLFIFFMEPCN